MPKFLWTGINTSGEQVKGSIFADSQDALKTQLLGQGVALLSYGVSDKKRWRIMAKLTPNDFIEFFEQISMLLDGGVDLLTAIRIIESQEQNERVRDILGALRDSLQNGDNIAVALSKHGEIFNDFVIQMIEVGLQSGQLSFVFMQVALYLKNKQQLKKELFNAALMPALTVFFALLIVVIILLVVVPQFETFFSSLGKKLPAATKTIIGMSHFLSSWRFLALITLIAGLGFGLLSLLGKKRVKRFNDRILIALPYVKNFVELSNFTYFIQAFTVLLKSGIPIKAALSCACNSMSNESLRAMVNGIIDDISRGRTLSDAMALLPKFYKQENLVALIRVGEQTGKLADVLGKITEAFQEELRRFVLILTSLFQPILLIIIGLIIGLMIWIIYLPIFNLAYSIA